METKASNGCHIAKRVTRADAGCHKPENIAAIDFGTTNCSLAYTVDGQPTNLLLFEGSFYRVPTAVLFDKNGTVTHFGNIARERYGSLEDDERLWCAYFEQIKMNLHQDESVNRWMKVKAKNGFEYYLVEIIAHILKYLKDELIKKVNHAGHDHQATEFDWVITVPAIWRARGKQMMREAAYKAGLCSQCSCTPLQPASHLPQPPVEKYPDKLSLALEPEAAAIFCQNMSKDQLAQQCQDKPHHQATSYLVIDIGGGTVDISAMQRVVDNGETHIHVFHRPTGNSCGGTQVNKEFRLFLETLVCDKGFKRLLSTAEKSTNATHQAVLNYLLNETFEKQKKLFGDRDTTTDNKRLQIELPYEFFETYSKELQSKLFQSEDKKQVKLQRQKLIMTCDFMATFFEPVRDGILEAIAQTLEKIEMDVETFYLVGGFGGCKYLFRAIEEKFGKKYKCIVPCEPTYAVVRGAVLNRQYPSMVESRKVDATYGIGTNIPFVPELHDPEYRWKDDDGEYKCKNIFSTIVECGDLAKSGEVFRATYYPVEHDQTTMKIEFYCSKEKDVWYVTGRRGRGSYSSEPVKVHKIGHILIDMPDLVGDKRRAVDVTFDFSHSEIQVQAFDRRSRNEGRTVLDFLTY